MPRPPRGRSSSPADSSSAPRSRRDFLALCGTAAVATTASLAGCTSPFQDAPAVVAAVEGKSIRATRENRNRKLVTSRPEPGPVGNDAPAVVDLRNVPYDDEFVSFPATGPLLVDDEMAASIDEFYVDAQYAVLVTPYEEEPVVGVPLGNSMGYHATREAFNRVDPGDRIVFRADPAADVATIDEVVAVTTAEE